MVALLYTTHLVEGVDEAASGAPVPQGLPGQVAVGIVCVGVAPRPGHSMGAGTGIAEAVGIRPHVALVRDVAMGVSFLLLYKSVVSKYVKSLLIRKLKSPLNPSIRVTFMFSLGTEGRHDASSLKSCFNV